MAYCTVEDVQSLSQPKITYDSTTRPTKIQVEGFIDEISGEMEVTILSVGYGLPITDVKALKYLRLINKYGSAALAEAAVVQQGNPDVSDWVETLFERYEKGLKRIETVPGALGSVIKTSSGKMRSMHTSNTADGSDPEYSDNTPFVTRTNDF